MALQVFDDFEDGDTAEWTVNDFSAVQDRVFNGSWSAKADSAQGNSSQANRVLRSGGKQIKQFVFYYQETSSSFGGGLRLQDSNGDFVCGAATNNPQWDVWGNSGFLEIDGGPTTSDYDVWVKVTFSFDWGAGTCTIEFEDVSSGYTASSTVDLINSTDVESVYVEDYSGSTWRDGSSIDMWFDYMQATPPPSIEQYNAKKTAEINSINDASKTVSKAAPIFLSDGDETTTGTGDCIIDFSSVSGEEDIAVFDENGDLLNYEIEELDTVNGNGLIWVYNDWTRDDTVQVQVAFGDNSANTDRQKVQDTWPSDALIVYHLDETSGQAIDSTSNNNDSSSTSGTTYNVDGLFDGGRELNGRGDIIDTPLTYDDTQPYTLVFDFNTDVFDRQIPIGKTDSNFDGFNVDFSRITTGLLELRPFTSNTGNIAFNTSFNEDTDYLISISHDGSAGYQLYTDGSPDGGATGTSNSTGGGNLRLGGEVDGDPYYDGTFSEFRFYNSEKSADWVQADYDASPKAGKVFFSWRSAEYFERVTTESASSVLGTSAQLNGELRTLDGNSSVDVYFEWRKLGSSTWNTTSTQTLTSTGAFSEKITGLSPNTTYEYRARGDIGDGSVVDFSTLEPTDILTDYSYNKSADATSLNSASLTKFPTFIRMEKTGDSTGTGVWGLKTNASITGKEDIGFFDENGNRVTYYWETFDTSNDVYEAWVLLDIVRDGGEEVQVGYGDGAADESTSESSFWSSVDNLEARYSFDRTSIDDSTGNYDAQSGGSTAEVDAVFGNGQDLERSNGDGYELRQGLENIFDANTEISIVTWINPESLPGSSSQMSIFHPQESSGGYDWNLWYRGTNLQWEYYNGSSAGPIRYDATGDDNDGFINYVFTYDPSNTGFEVFRNGGSVASQTWSGSPATQTRGLTIGYRGGRGDNFDGVMDEFHFYNDLKSSDWIESHYDMSSEGGYSLFSVNSSQSVGGEITQSLTEDLAMSDLVQSEAFAVTIQTLSEAVGVSDEKSFLKKFSREFSETVLFQDSSPTSSFITLSEGVVADLLTGKEVLKLFSENVSLDSVYSDNAGFIVGTVDLDGSSAQGANVYIVKEDDGLFKGADVTDAQGDYSIGQVVDDGSRYLVAVDFYDGSDRYGFQKSIEVDFN